MLPIIRPLSQQKLTEDEFYTTFAPSHPQLWGWFRALLQASVGPKDQTRGQDICRTPPLASR